MPLAALMGVSLVGNLVQTGVGLFMQHQQHKHSMEMLQQFQGQNNQFQNQALGALGAPGYGPEQQPAQGGAAPH